MSKNITFILHVVSLYLLFVYKNTPIIEPVCFHLYYYNSSPLLSITCLYQKKESLRLLSSVPLPSSALSTSISPYRFDISLVDIHTKSIGAQDRYPIKSTPSPTASFICSICFLK